MIVTALFHGIWGLHTLDGKTKHCVSNLAILDCWVELFFTVFRLDVTDFVVPPHHSLPVRLVIFKEHSVVIRVLSQSDHDVLGRGLLRLLYTLESEHLKSLSDIQNSSFFSSFVLQMNATSFTVFVLWD